MDSTDLAKYIDETNGISKPWLLIQLRLSKLKERRAELSHEEYILELPELHDSLMSLGQWWRGREAEVFGTRNNP